MAFINKQDTNGARNTLAEGEFGYDAYTAGGDRGRVYIGTNSGNVSLATKAEVDTKLPSASYTAADVLSKLITVDGAGSTLDADTVDGIQGASLMRTDTDDTFTGKLSVGSTSNRSAGMYGTYDINKTAHIWSMGTAYAIPNDGLTFGNLYGFAYKHTTNTTGGTMAGGHQAVWCVNGTGKAAIGESGMWTSGYFYGTATSALYADLAENYLADKEYTPGQVLGVGGINEVTLYQPGMAVAGVVSTNPAFRMNDAEEVRENPLYIMIALKGKIPCQVNGVVSKGQYVVADADGKGKAVNDVENMLTFLGVALEDGYNNTVMIKV